MSKPFAIVTGADLATTDGVDRLWAATAGRPVDALVANRRLSVMYGRSDRIVRHQDGTTRSTAGPILGALGCRAPTPPRPAELCRTRSGCRPLVGDHRAASLDTGAPHLRRLTTLIGTNRAHDCESVDESERFTWNGFAIAH